MGAASAEGSATATATVANPHGIHARPSHALVTAAAGFDARVELEWQGRCADARSILSVMTLGAPGGARITVRAQGPQAVAAVAALVAILEAPEPA